MLRIVKRFLLCCLLALNCAFVALGIFAAFELDLRALFKGWTFDYEKRRLRYGNYELLLGKACIIGSGAKNDFAFSAKSGGGNVYWKHWEDGNPKEHSESLVIHNDVLANGFWISWKQNQFGRCYDISIEYNDISYFDKDGIAEKVILRGETEDGNRWMKLVDFSQMSNCVQRAKE